MSVLVLSKYSVRNRKYNFEYVEYDKYLDCLVDRNHPVYQGKYEFVVIFAETEHVGLVNSSILSLNELVPQTKIIVVLPLTLHRFLFEEDRKIYGKYIEIDPNKVLFNKIGVLDPKYQNDSYSRFSPIGRDAIFERINEIITISKAKRYKCVIVDLDETLWAGTLAEGNAHTDFFSEEFSKFLFALKKSGIVLCTCSKNNEKEALDFLNKNSLLIEEDFLIHKINWLPKIQNIAEILAALNIGPESCLFIDDSMHECESVKYTFPTMDVHHFDRLYLEDLYKFHRLDSLSLTEEDKQKNEFYKGKLEFDSNKTLFTNYEDFLQQLEIRITIEANTNYERAAQLIQKTNKFKLNDSSFTADELSGWNVYTFSYKDKFGSQGIIGVVVVNDYDIVLQLAVSCRILGRGVEDAILDWIDKQFFNIDHNWKVGRHDWITLKAAW